MVQITTLDYVVFGIFILLLASLGFSAKLKSNSVVNYLLAGRALSLPLCLTSLVCTWYGGILGIGESVSYYGLGTWLLLGVPYYVFALIYAIWMSKKVQINESFSIPEMLGKVYGDKVRTVSGILIYMLAVPAAHVLMIGTLIHWTTGLPTSQSVIIAAVAGGALLYRGGLMADVRVSILSFAMMYIAFGMIVLICINKLPVHQMVSIVQDKGMWDFKGNQSPVQILGFLLLGAWTIVDPGFHQRIASAKTPKIGQLTVFWAIGFWIIFDILMITAGLYALAFNVNPENKLEIFPALAGAILPPGLLAAFICGILGTTFCAMVGYLLLAGSTISRDVFRTSETLASSVSLETEENSQKQVTRTRIGIIVSLLLAIVLALLVKSVVALWYSFGGIVVGSLLVPVLFGYLSNQKRPLKNVLSSILASSLVSSGLWIWGTATGNPYIEITLADGSKFGFGTLVPGLIVSILVLGFGKLVPRNNLKKGIAETT